MIRTPVPDAGTTGDLDGVAEEACALGDARESVHATFPAQGQPGLKFRSGNEIV